MTKYEAKFTAGPWRISEKSARLGPDSYITIISDERWVAHVFEGAVKSEEDARLIAAAPDLLEALENIKHAAQYGLNALPAEDPFRKKIQLNIDAANAAIAKATKP